jgi:c-di-GMP-binding flagellar brake protein YcgR
MPEDKRKECRLEKTLRVQIKEFRFPLAKQPTIEVNCEDISAGGLAVECRRKFVEGDKLQVRVYIPSFNKYHPGFFKVFESDAGQYLQAIAEVVRVRELVPFTSYELGVKFLDVDHDDWNALRKYIGKMV